MINVHFMCILSVPLCTWGWALAWAAIFLVAYSPVLSGIMVMIRKVPGWRHVGSGLL